MKLTRSKAYVLVAAAALLALAAGVASGAIPSADGTISACKNGDGELKVIDVEAGQACKGNQKLLTWNLQGPAGEDGVSGYEKVYNASDTNSAGDKTEWVFCPSGKKVLGGGAGVYGAMTAEGQIIVDGTGIVQSHPFNDYGWAARAEEFVPTDDDWQLSVWAVCADVS